MRARDSVILGIETSCDETAAAVVRRCADGTAQILSDVVFSQFEAHARFGGVVPEIAARAHVERADAVIDAAMRESGLSYAQLDAVAATAGPGLIGGVIVGLTAGKALSLAYGLPLVPVNHLEGHALSARMSAPTPFPYLLLLVSGGHTQLLKVSGVGRYLRLGTTIDDAAGEAFDKTAKLLGLGHPGGPKLEAAAAGGRAGRFKFPRMLRGRAGCDFSFSGLKTAVRLAAEKLDAPDAQDAADLAAGFQAAAAAHLAERTGRAIENFDAGAASGRLVVAGGVAANGAIRTALSEVTEAHGWELIVPPAKHCTDNGAMIAWAGAERLAAGLDPAPEADPLAFAPRARWPLDADSAAARPAYGGGRKGPKA